VAGLRLLVGIARHGSIGAAAKALAVSQQSASERLRGMEAQTGLTLVQRGARGSELTAAGVVVTEWAARLLELTDEIEVALEGLRDERSHSLTVWASMTIAESLVPRWLVQLRRRRDDTSVSLTAANSHDVVDAVASGDAQLGFVEGVEAPRGLRSRAVGADELVLVAAPGTAVARRTSLTPAEVAVLPLTSREPGSGTRQVVERALAAQGLSLHPSVVELTTATAIRESVLAGSAPAFLSRRVVVRDLDAGHLVGVRTPDLDLHRVFRAVWVGSAQPPAGPVRDLVSIAGATAGP